MTTRRPSEGTTVVTTVFNEAGSIQALVESLLSQTEPPSEIVVTDAGSTDGTGEILAELSSRDGRLRVLSQRGNRSRGRNAAIEAAANDLIACIDAGCTAQRDWLEKLMAPFAEGAEWVAGFYRPIGPTLKSTCIGLVMVFVLEEALSGGYLPSARSMAFRKGVWRSVGGFPEDADFAEDTLFDEGLMRAGVEPHFAADALVLWTPPTTYRALARTAFRWGRGDGLAGLRGPIYKRMLAWYLATAIALIAAALWRGWLAPIALMPLATDLARRTRHKYRWASGALKYLHIPAAHLTASLAALAGFLCGRSLRRRSR